MSLEELLRACVDIGDESVWREFVAHFHALIAGVALKTARRWGETSPGAIEDLVQETYLKLCADPKRMLAQFEARHSDAFYGYLKVVTCNLVNDHYRARHSRRRDTRQEQPLQPSIAEMPNKGMGSKDEIEKSVLLSEIDSVLKNHSEVADPDRDRAIFWLYYRQGMTAQAIAELPDIGLTVKGVESLVFRLTKLVRERLSAQRCSLEAS
jgi:RNA polymerase sigma-70 factor, ECF subfamily